MDFLSLNGWGIPIAFNQAKMTPVRTSALDRNFYGRRRAVTRKMDFSWEFQTPPLTYEEAECLIGLLEGQGHHFDFQADFWSDSGLGPEAGFTAAAGVSAGGPYTSFGKQAWHDGVGSEYVIYDAKLRNRYTVMHWRSEDGTTWEHAAITYDGTTTTKYIDGAASGAALTTISVDSTTGAVTQTYALDGGTAYEAFDDLVILPFFCPADAISAFYDWMTEGERQFSSLPNLSAWGSMFAGMEMTCRGIVKDYKMIKTGTESDRVAVSFELKTFDGRGSVHIPAPVFYMSMGDAAADGGGAVWEQSDSALQGTRTGVTRNVKGKIGACWSFDGVDDFVSFGNVLDYDVGEAFAWSAWIKPNSGRSGVSAFIAKDYSGGGNAPYAMWVQTDGTVSAIVHGSSTNVQLDSSAGAAPDDTWTHVVFQRTSSGLELWVNGVLVDSDVDATVASTSIAGLNIGRQYDNTAGNEFDGFLDEIANWDQTLTQQQIERLYELGSKGLSFMGNARTGP